MPRPRKAAPSAAVPTPAVTKKRGRPARTEPTPKPAAPASPKVLRGKAKVLASKVSFKGKVFHVTTDTVTEPGGVTSTRDVVRHSGSVVILAVDFSRSKKNPTILVERQYRYAAGQFLHELPAGRIEPGETPLAAAKRELIEETGFRAARWSRLVRFYASPGFLAEHMQIFLAEDITQGVAQPEPDEKITLTQVPLTELLQQIEEGHIQDGKTIVAVLLFASHFYTRGPRRK